MDRIDQFLDIGFIQSIDLSDINQINYYSHDIGRDVGQKDFSTLIFRVKGIREKSPKVRTAGGQYVAIDSKLL